MYDQKQKSVFIFPGLSSGRNIAHGGTVFYRVMPYSFLPANTEQIKQVCSELLPRNDIEIKINSEICVVKFLSYTMKQKVPCVYFGRGFIVCYIYVKEKSISRCS